MTQSSIPWDELMDMADESSVEPFPAGDYDVKVVSSEATQSSTKKPMWKIVVEVENGHYAGRKVWTQQTLSTDNETAVAMFFKTMNAMGLNRQYFATRPSNTEIAAAMVGRRARVKVGVENYQGEDRNKITKWLPLIAGGLTPPTPGAAAPPPPPAATAAAPPPPPAPAPAAPAPAAAPAAAAPPPPPPPPPAPAAAPEAPAAAPAAPPAPPAAPAPAAPPAAPQVENSSVPPDEPPF